MPKTRTPRRVSVRPPAIQARLIPTGASMRIGRWVWTAQPAAITREFWYSPLLGINLLSPVDSPRTGRQTFTVTEGTTSEPEPHIFAVPDGSRIVDQRKSEPAQP